ncbi:MAG: hypothetical protein KHZ58_13745 [Hungatella hathewayi]|nr:hypothetical protein [Hungatella hathewayi]
MSNIKERILGAVTVMNDKDAEKVWDLIQSTFALSNAEEVEPDTDELTVLNAYRNGSPEYQPSVSHEELLKELGL